MVNLHASLRHHFFEIAIAEAVPEIPPDTQNDNLFGKTPAPESISSITAHPGSP